MFFCRWFLCLLLALTLLGISSVASSQQFSLSINKAGTGTGTVTGKGSRLKCGSVCSANIDAIKVVTLSAKPAKDSIFAGWSGDADCSDGNVTMDSAKTCTATFTTYNLVVNKSGDGTGTITSKPSGIKCGNACTENVRPGTVLTLTAKAAKGSVFAGWSGACFGIGTCTITMTSAKLVSAQFNAANHATVIAALSPDNGPSGTTVTITGQGFIPNSNVTIGGVVSPLVEFVSETEIHALVPLITTLPPKALPPGAVQITVNGTASANFEVTPLPENPNPPGVVLATALSVSGLDTLSPFGNLAAGLADIEALTPDPIDRDYIATLREAIEPLEALSSHFLPQLYTLDADSLAMFEKLLLQALADPQPANASSAMHALAEPSGEPCTATDGNVWLDQRSGLQSFVQLKVADATRSAASMVCPSIPGFSVCGPIGSWIKYILKIAQNFLKTQVQAECGVIKALNVPAAINVSRVNPPTLTASIDTQRQIPVSPPEKWPQPAEIPTGSDQPPEVQKALASVKSQIDKLVNSLLNKPDIPLEPGPVRRPVTPAYLTVSPAIFFGLFVNQDCLFGISITKIDSATGLVTALTRITQAKSFSCGIIVNEDLSVEGDSGKTNLNYNLVPSFQVKVAKVYTTATTGSVTFQPVPESRNCDADVECREYEAGKSAWITAVPGPTSQAQWTGCSDVFFENDCIVNVGADRTVTVEFKSKGPSIVGTYELVSYRGIPMGGFCGEADGCNFSIVSGSATITAFTWAMAIIGRNPGHPDPVVIFSNSGHWRFDRITTSPLNIPQDPDCTGAPHNVPFKFYCGQLPPGWLYDFEFLAFPNQYVPMAVLLPDGSMVSGIGGQTVWRKVQ